MAVEELHDHPDGAVIDAAVCIVGTGPAGTTVALQLAAAGVEVCLVESGGDAPDPDAAVLSEFEDVGMHRAPPDTTRARGLGGTSSLWSGRCAIFDPLDYAERPWVPHSGWPIDHDDLAPHLASAGALLGLGPGRYCGTAVDLVDPPPGGGWDPDLLLPLVFQASAADPGRAEVLRDVVEGGVAGAELIGVLQHAGTPQPVNFGTDHVPRLAGRPNVRILRRATAVEVELDTNGTRVAGVQLAGLDGRRARVRAQTVVLACGGIDNARLLLSSRASDPRGVGNQHDLVGRFLMDHPFAPVATLGRGASRRLRRRFGQRWVDRDGARHVYSVGVRLSPALQRAEGLLNAQMHTVDQGDLRSSLRRVRDAVMAVRRDGARFSTVAELAAAARRPDQLAWMAYERQVLRRPSLVDADRVVFGCVVEQVPDPASRITLADRLDPLGVPLARIDWRADDAEVATLQRMVDVLLGEIRRLGDEPPTLAPWLSDGAAGWRATVHDMAHPMGTTRMADDPRRGVVDRRCGVHGVGGLYVAGSSVFPTSGTINPTLTIVALALRLAEHLRSEVGRVPAVAAPRARAEPPIRVGLVGVGHRMTDAILPALRALPERFEVVGCSSRSSERRTELETSLGVPGFESPGALVDGATPDLLVVAVNSWQVDGALPAIVELGVPLLVETPVAWQVAAGRALVRRIDQLGVCVGVAEQTPYLPVEQLKQKAIGLGLLGRISSAENHYAEFDYHALATLRRALGPGRIAERVQASASRLGDAEVVTATVTFEDGAVLLHRAIADGSARPAGVVPRLVLHGDAGSFVGDEFVTLGPSGEPVVVPIERITGDDGSLLELVLAAPSGTVRWRNPFAGLPLDDQGIAVATVLTAMADAVRTGDDPPYLPVESLQDMEIIAAMRYSQAGHGRAVRLPVHRLDQARARLADRRG